MINENVKHTHRYIYIHRRKFNMKHQVVHTDNAPKAIGPYSQAVKAGNMLFVSGQVPFVPETMEIVEGDVKAQTAQSLKNVQAILAEAGLDLLM